MTASVRSVLMAALADRLRGLAEAFPGLAVEVNRPEGEAVDRFPTLVLVTDERAGADEAIADDVYCTTLLARPIVVGWVTAGGRVAADAAADELAVAVAQAVGAADASLGPGWIDTMDRPVEAGATPSAVTPVASFQLPLSVTYQHVTGNPAAPGV